jgi:hypothetical protein
MPFTISSWLDSTTSGYNLPAHRAHARRQRAPRAGPLTAPVSVTENDWAAVDVAKLLQGSGFCKSALDRL